MTPDEEPDVKPMSDAFKKWIDSAYSMVSLIVLIIGGFVYHEVRFARLEWAREQQVTINKALIDDNKAQDKIIEEVRGDLREIKTSLRFIEAKIGEKVSKQ